MPRKPSQQKQGTPRIRLSASFLESLEKDFEKHRDEVIEALRKESPKAYAELLGRLIQTTDAPDTKGFKDCNGQRDIGLRLLVSMGMQEDKITDEQIDLAIIANDRFLASLEEIAGTTDRKDLN
jgi:hypothetical protein